MVAAPLSEWRFESRLPWPGVRGRRLWQHVTAQDDVLSADAHAAHANAPLAQPQTPSLAAGVRYEVETCEATAGHVALVLLRREPPGSEDPARHVPTPTVPSGAAQLAIPRVLYVVDAVPPDRASSSSAANNRRGSSTTSTHTQTASSNAKPVETKWTMLSSSTRAHSFAGSTATTADAFGGHAMAGPQQHSVDELALVEELFTTTRATKDACILAKPPLLCARFDCRLIAVKFVRHPAASSRPSTGSSSTGAASASSSNAGSGLASPLRCIVAREDGMCYIWEWSGDLQTWSFLNRFCFLENPNLKWTRPVLLFAAVHCPTWSHNASSSDAVETTELSWWSAETKEEPKLFVRKIQFGVEKSTFRTEIRIGSAFHVAAQDVETLRSSSRGLWVVSRSQGVQLRSATSLRTLHADWPTLLGSSVEGDVLTCVHSVTGELVVVERGSGGVFVVSTSATRDDLQLQSKRLLTIKSSNPQEDDDHEAVQSVAAHRQLLVTLTDHRVAVHSLVSGQKLVSLALPTAHWPVEMPLTLWTTSSGSGRGAGASAVGLFAARGYWQLHTPSAHALVALHTDSSNQSETTLNALRVAKPYGPTLDSEAARVALEILQSAKELVGSQSPAASSAWESAIQSLSSPALLLATLAQPQSNATPHHKLLDDMAELVAAIYRVTHEILVTGRFGAAVEKRDDALLLRGLPFVTPANVESLHHLANWVLLAKRKVARLQGSVVHKGSKRLRARTLSSLTTFSEDGEEVDAVSDAAAIPPLNPLHHHDSADDDDESSSQLSRKLRPMTSLQFAAGSCSVRHGRQWLAQLETLLMPHPSPSQTHHHPLSSLLPHALLFHEERTLDDFQVALSSFSKHMYFESMSRLYLLHDAAKLLAFVQTIAHLAPRLFTLSGTRQIVRTHAERALTLLPPAHVLVQRVKDEVAATRQKPTPTLKHGRVSMGSGEDPSAKDSLMAYTELLLLCGYTVEACRVLLDADLYEECLEKLLRTKSRRENEEEDEDEDAVQTREAAVFFSLLEYCVAQRDAKDLESLLSEKPRHVDALLVLRALKQMLPRKIVASDEKGGDASGRRRPVSVGALRQVLLRLLREHKADQAARTTVPVAQG